ncbi:MAG: class I SAM-dependent methyltransferase [Pseudomonadota bacterium]
MRHMTPPDRMEALATRPWVRLSERALGKARRVPTMLSEEEQKLYYWLTAFWAEGRGATVDLGCFAGGSTARLAEGHRTAGHAAKVHGFDRFTADETAKRRVLYAQTIAPFDGHDILPLTRTLLTPWRDQVRLHRGEIDQMAWTGGPIELLVMDASKAAVTGDAMAETFFPYLLPGASLVISQDYLHWSQPWVPAQMDALSAFFRPVAHAPRDTVIFACERVPDRAALEAARIAGLDDAALDAHLSNAEAQVSDWGLAPRFADMRAALAANPGKRRAHLFVRP